MYIDNLTACGILVPQPGIRQTPSATEVWGPNQEFPTVTVKINNAKHLAQCLAQNKSLINVSCYYYHYDCY